MSELKLVTGECSGNCLKSCLHSFLEVAGGEGEWCCEGERCVRGWQMGEGSEREEECERVGGREGEWCCEGEGSEGEESVRGWEAGKGSGAVRESGV